MNTIIVTKRSALLLGLIAVFVGLTLFFPGCNCNNIELLGEAQIVIYQQGEKTVLDPHSRYYKQLQAACEEMLISAESLWNFLKPINQNPNQEEIKNREWALELEYQKRIGVSLPLGIGPAAAFYIQIEVDQYMIPLTGEWSHVKAEGVKSFDQGIMEYTCLFFFPEIVSGDHQWEGLIGTNKGVQKIKDTLTRFDINIP